MPAYVLIEIKILDPQLYSEYLEKVPATVRQFGGRYLVRGGTITEMAGGWKPERMILMEFESQEQIRRWLASPEYQAIAPLRTRATSSRAVILEGYSPAAV